MSQAHIRLLLGLATIAALITVAFNLGYAEQVSLVMLSVGLLILSLTVMVTLHELGHFLPARLFGIRVDKFYLFFDFLFPLPHILNFALFKIKKGGTEYGIGWFPMGGYVQIAGMIDEQMDENAVKGEAQPWEFRSKPVWQRMIVMVGGVVMNVILGIVIFTGVKYKTGEEHLPMSEVKYGISVPDSSLGSLVGFKTGDELVSFKGKPLPYFDDYASPNLLLEDGAYYEVKRGGEIVKIMPPRGILDRFNDKTIRKEFFIPELPAFVMVAPDYPAAKAGLQSGDRILRVDSTDVNTFTALRAAIKDKANQTLTLVVDRKGARQTFSVTLNAEARMGVTPDVKSAFKTDTIEYTLGQAFVEGTKHAFSIITMNAKGFSKIGSGEASVSKSLQGPVEIAAMFAQAFMANGWLSFWILTGSLSMVLAFVNILPIPALDGGHLVFLLIEMVTGKEPSIRVRMVAQQIGMVIVLGLMAFVLLKGFAGLI